MWGNTCLPERQLKAKRIISNLKPPLVNLFYHRNVHFRNHFFVDTIAHFLKIIIESFLVQNFDT